MTVVINGTTGITDVNGTAAAPAITGTTTTAGVFFPATNTVGFSTSGAEVARFDASGNLGVGTSSPSGRLHVVGGNVFIGLNSGSTTNLYIDNGLISSNAGGVPLRFGINDTEKARIDSSGNLLLGISSGTVRFYSYNASGDNVNYFEKASGSKFLIYNSTSDSYIGTTTSTPLRLATGDVERARIDTSGNLLVGKTASAATSVGFQVGQLGEVYATKSTSTNADATYYLYSTGAAAYRFYVGLGGTINATSTTITGISDQRLKENIRDLDDGLEKVMALQPRKFDWKEGKGQNIKNARGFIAQEFETVFPDMIEQWMDEPPEGEEPYKAVNANLIPTLVKAIQELKAEFDAYKAAHP